MNEVIISIYHDKRRLIAKTKDIYPVRLRVYSTIIQRKKLYSTNINLSEKEFHTFFETNDKIRGRNLETQLFLFEFLNRAQDVVDNLTVFTFEAFERKLFRKKEASINVLYHYDQKISALKENQQVATADNYQLSAKSIGMFLLNRVEFKSIEVKNLEIHMAIKSLTFYDITPKWLHQYEKFMVQKHGKSYTTLSMYLRALRTIFNDAISLNDIKSDIYPFGRTKGLYQIPTSQTKKKSLSSKQLALLFNATPSNIDEQKAKDFWFLSYALYGMNFKDISLMTYENMTDDTIVYYREKTKTTSRGRMKKISVHLNPYAKEVIRKYSKKTTTTKTDYIFPIVEKGDDAFEQKRKIKNFISHVNLFFNKFAESIGFEFKITTYWARHSFATVSIQNGASMEFISEALSHSNLNVTKNYFSGFEDETKKEFANSLMNF